MRLSYELVNKVDLQNFDEAGCFGAPVDFYPHQLPDSTPMLNGERIIALMDAGLAHLLTGNWSEGPSAL